MKKIVAALIGSSALALSACGSSTDDAAINLGLTVVDSAGGRLQPDSRFRLDEWLASPDRFSGILSDAGTLLDQEVLYSTGADLESLKL
jgi:hypothetical protein